MFPLHMSKILLSGLAGVLLAVAPGASLAQTLATGTVSGRVVIDATGEPAHGASILIVGARRTASAGEDGRFEVANVPAGRYEVIAQREHFSADRQTVTVAAGQRATLEFRLVLSAVHEEVTVTASAIGAATTFESFNAITTLDSTEIVKRLGAGVADVLQDEPGVAKRTFGPGSSRPIIRGFDGDRVLIMQDGVRTGDLSSQSGDHGVSIDPAGLARLEVVKGPATLLYGSNAIGGVVNAITPQDGFRTTPFTGLLGSVSLDMGSANGQGGVAASVQRGRGPFLLYGSATTRRTGDYDSPDGPVRNSATRLTTGEGGVGWTGRRAFLGVGAGGERNRYGVPFAGLLEGEEDADVDLAVRRQSLRVDAGARHIGRFADTLRLTLNVLDYEHDEIEVEDGDETVGTQFSNRVVTVRGEIEQRPTGRLGGRFGFEVYARDYEASGAEALAPATRHRSVAAFAYEELNLGRQRLQFGGRLERNRYDSATDRTFTGASGAVGVRSALGAGAAIVVNVTGASRAPALEELFNFGPHPGNLAFEIGNADLGLERTAGLDVSLRSRHGRIHGEVNAFVYAISNFVFLDVTDEIEDGLRVSHYEQGDSRFSGFEAAAHVEAVPQASIHVSLSHVRARLTESGEALPRIPPFRGRLGLDVRRGALTISPEVVFSARQAAVSRGETPTDGWATVNAGVSWQRAGSHATHLVAAQVYNLGNTTYRLHTSFLKDLAPEVGRGAKLTYTVRFY
jgi:iron complex outermembrane receptor protein